MKYITAIAILTGLLGIGMPCHMPSAATANAPLDEMLFIQITRDMELLNSWLVAQHYPPETSAHIQHQSSQSLLALYKVDLEAYQASIAYYFTSSLEKALETYSKLYIALEKVGTAC
ncbi:MAG: hypothetical protein NQ127_02035 [Candidatus Cardinium sp.]|nr:hypothetical protein [Candidatus Cardinium sp.]